jgi:K+-sensing histidine kinase KdpD
MDKRYQQRVEKSHRSQTNAGGIDDKGAIEVLQDDMAAVSRHLERLHELRQIIAKSAQHLQIATQILSGSDIAKTVVEFARRNQVTQIFWWHTPQIAFESDCKARITRRTLSTWLTIFKSQSSPTAVAGQVSRLISNQ